MTTANPPVRYGAHVKSARTGGFATAELHHQLGRDHDPAFRTGVAGASRHG